MAIVTFSDIPNGSPRDIVPINQRFAAIKTQLNGNIDVDNLANDAVETAKIKDLNVTTDKLADDCVTVDKLAVNAVVTENIANDAITSTKIAREELTPTLSFGGTPSSQTVEVVRVGDTLTINAKVGYGGSGQTMSNAATLVTLSGVQVVVENMYFMAAARTNGGSFVATPCYVTNSGADIVIKKYAELASVVEFDFSITLVLA